MSKTSWLHWLWWLRNSKKNVLFQRADKRSKFARNYISFCSLPKQAGQNKTSKENNKHVILVHIISHRVFLTFCFLRNVLFLLFTRWYRLYFVRRKLYIFSSFQFQFLFHRHKEFSKFFCTLKFIILFFYFNLIKIPSALLNMESPAEKSCRDSG